MNFVYYDFRRTTEHIGSVLRKILVIEDNPDICDLVCLHLRDLGYSVDVEMDGEKGFGRAVSGEYQLIILDLMLPGMNGLEICTKLRADFPYISILMLTAKSSEVDRIVGLETGADDYLTKPFGIYELLARVKAIFRRVEILSAKQQHGDKCIVCGPLEIDLDRRAVQISGANIALTAKEFDLLAQFAANPGKVYTRKQLLDLVWGYQHDGYEHTVNSHINRLRGKIEPDRDNPKYLLTVWGVGYKFSDLIEQRP